MTTTEKEPEGIHVNVDLREKETTLAAVDMCPAVTSWSIEKLEAGDLEIRGVLFERKTWSDYASALRGSESRTWEDQLRKLKEADVPAYVLIDGNLPEAAHLTHSEMNPESLWGSAASVTAREGIPVIPCGDTDHLIRHAVRLARKHTEEPGAKGFKTSAIGPGEDPVLRMYACIPGVGPKTARALYERFPTMPELVATAPSTLESTEGVGPKTAEAIYDTLRGLA